jgi:hypothetical protein
VHAARPDQQRREATGADLDGPLAQQLARREDVPCAVELRDGDPVSELSQAGVAATCGAAVVVGV